MAVGARYTRSGLQIADAYSDASAANTFAGDIGGYYQSEQVGYIDFDGRWRPGFNIQNLGPKLSYDDDEFSSNFLPTNLRLGAGFDFIMDEYNTIGFTVETSMLLVPTPQYEDGMTADEIAQTYDDYQKTNWVSG